MAEHPQPRKRTRAHRSTGGGTIRIPELAPSLESFSILQRHVATLDYRAITSARNAMAEAATAMPIPQIVAAQQAIAKQFAQLRR